MYFQNPAYRPTPPLVQEIGRRKLEELLLWNLS